MTAEIAIMNKEGIALASDSAVTGQKIFTSANKLFALSKYQPVGIMIYGNATFMGIPWETLIKIYRKKLGKNKYDTLSEYVKEFLNFLDNGNSLFPESVQKMYFEASINDYFGLIVSEIKEKVDLIITEKGKIDENGINEIIEKTIEEHYEKWEKTKNIPSIPENYGGELLIKYGKLIDNILTERFEKIPLSESQLNKIRTISVSLFSKYPEDVNNQDISGIVIAGFGEKDIFPSLESVHIEGIVNDRLKYIPYKSNKISYTRNAVILPFAQGDMVATFMEGVDPTYRDVEQELLFQTFNHYSKAISDIVENRTEEQKKEFKEKLTKVGEEIVKDFINELGKYRYENYVSPVISVVSMLPKDELAFMAETLVNLTSFKRKVTIGRETVGGPIDVAIISKGDGFVWIKRKHYFKSELNSQFFAKYCNEG